MLELTLKDIQNKIPGSQLKNCDKPEDIKIQFVGSLDSDKPYSISFLSRKSMLGEAKNSRAVALIVSEELSSKLDKPLLVVSNVDLELARILNILYPPKQPEGKISKNAFIEESAKIGENTSIGNYVSVGKNSIVGKNCIIEDGVKIGENVKIGDNARIGMNCVFFHETEIGDNFVVFGNSSFGGDGFRFISRDGVYTKIPQIGKVIIGSDVEIGSNCAVDRGGPGDTIIGDGCKFDNMVHVAHNVKIGKNVVIAGMSGVAGSTTIEDGVIIGGGCCISDHLYLEKGTIIAGGTGLRTSPKKPDMYIGWDWGMTFAEFQKARVNIKHLIGFNKWVSRIKSLEKKLGINSDD